MNTAVVDRPANPTAATAPEPGGAGREREVYESFDRAYTDHWQAQPGQFWSERYPASHAAYANLVHARNRRVVALARGGRAVLDIGAGFGDVLHLLRGKYPVLRGVDPSGRSCAMAADNFRGRGVGNDYRFDRGLAEALPHEAGAFDTVLCLDTYEHVEPMQRHAALLEARRVLAPGGELILVTPSRRVLRVMTVLDNLLTMRRQIRCLRNPRMRRPIELLSLPKKTYCEVFCTAGRLRRELVAAGFEVARFERVSFYPAPERGGFLHPFVDKRPPGHWVVRGSVRFVNFMERLRVFNQKMLVVARAAPGGAADEIG
jgi:SAM-dependent methyltransferase